MNPARIVLLVAALAALATAGEARAQEATPSPHGRLGGDTDCAACHLPTAWTPVREPMAFDHNAQTAFALAGAHADADCRTCHLGLRFDQPRLSSSDCGRCHVDVHQGALGGDCAGCHNLTSFLDVQGEDLHARTAFPLTGAHGQIACESCHKDDRGGAFSPLDTECYGCHRDDYEGAESIDHVAAEYPTECAQCHNTVAWQHSVVFDHVAASQGFALLGAHGALPCAACHIRPGNELIWQPADQEDCITCHEADYERQHGGSGTPRTCLNCHGVDSWETEEFDHVAASGGFELRGPHGELACTACHTGPDNAPLWQPADEEDCIACHQDEYDREHAGSGFSTTCVSCHDADTWEGVTFDHGTLSQGFDLVGAHGRLACAACHVEPGNTPIWDPAGDEDCVTCHRDDYDREHTGTGFSETCTSCHGVETWQGATFDHATASNGFDLVGAHGRLVCASCHVQPGNQSIWDPAGDEDCVTCHRDDYDREHAGSGFTTTCAQCHGVETWAASFDHGVLSNGFDLLGAHGRLACAACHVEPGNVSIWHPAGEEDCVTCHQDDYDREHAGSGFTTTCTSCHTIDTWEGAVFDHGAASGGFDLLGAHVQLPCSACHLQPGNVPIWHPAGEEDCITCHQDDYDREHAGSGFPTTCTTCHNMNTWDDATFDHDASFFPINSGRHAGEWSTCAECHPNASDYSVFTCLSCHEHNQTDMDDKHQGEPGYAYESSRCLSCHPTGQAND